MKITVVSGRAHNTHTEGGDFREATYRAVRQGLKEAESILLEPYYTFRLEVPEKTVGKAITDIEKMHGTWEIAETNAEMIVLLGSAPVVTMRNYHREVMAYTRGLGRLFCSLAGYKPCHDAAEVIANVGYDSERDVENPTGSIFCSQGAGFLVTWDRVKDHMHVESFLHKEQGQRETVLRVRDPYPRDDLDEIDYELIDRTVSGNRGKKLSWNRRKTLREMDRESISEIPTPHEPKEDYLLVDGYNVIHAWPELKELVHDNMDIARIRLLDVLSSYQVFAKCQIIVVFDAYRVQRPLEDVLDYFNINVVFTKEAQTADEYIEKFAHDNQKKHNIVVATSDSLQQVIIRGAGSALLSARELREEIERVKESTRRSYEGRQSTGRTNLEEALSSETKQQFEGFWRENE